MMIDHVLKQKHFSFLIDGVPMEERAPEVRVEREGIVTRTVYRFSDGLVLTNLCRYYPAQNACDWVNEWTHTGDAPSGLISELWDGDVELSLPPCTPKTTGKAYLPEPEQGICVAVPRGSEWSGAEFSCNADELRENDYPYWLMRVGSKRRYATVGGRSSDSVCAPFFHIRHGGEDVGYVLAVGWTGQWHATVERNEGGVHFRSGIEDARFRLLPGESIRTSSLTVMAYRGTAADGQNAWRRLLREVYAPLKEPARELPFSIALWGGMNTSDCLARIRRAEEWRLPSNCYWMDAGWYGDGTAESPDEYEGDWAHHTGNWTVNAARHPDGLLEVADTIRATGKRYLLWFEPERVRMEAPLVKEHPEYLIFPEGEKNKNCLLNLGNEDAWRYCFETISDIIERLGVSVYRQDFNFQPLPYWQKNDTEDRRGMTEIKHIGGLYRLWDALRARFPGLLIDNCSSGGRRIDIETLRRSIPLWRSDAMCPAAIDAEIGQAHAISFGSWLPYSGTGAGRTLYDTYRFRSAYAPAMSTNYFYSASTPLPEDPSAREWTRRMFGEYLRVRPYLFKDIYPLTVAGTAKDAWSAVQYHDPDTDTGVVQIFRREQSPYEEACLRLCGLSDAASYVFEDADTGEEALSGDALGSRGWRVRVEEARTAKVYFYRRA